MWQITIMNPKIHDCIGSWWSALEHIGDILVGFPLNARFQVLGLCRLWLSILFTLYPQLNIARTEKRRSLLRATYAGSMQADLGSHTPLAHVRSARVCCVLKKRRQGHLHVCPSLLSMHPCTHSLPVFHYCSRDQICSTYVYRGVCKG